MKKENSWKIILTTIIIILITFVVFIGTSTISFLMNPPKNGEVSSTNKTLSETQVRKDHTHAALLVFVKGEAIDFSDTKYQNQDLLIHLENGDEITLHNHSKSAYLGMFFKSLNVTFAKNCLILNNGSSYCSDFVNQISFVVNGKPDPQFQHYIPNDGDRILVSYGKPEQIKLEQDILNAAIIART